MGTLFVALGTLVFGLVLTPDLRALERRQEPSKSYFRVSSPDIFQIALQAQNRAPILFDDNGRSYARAYETTGQPRFWFSPNPNSEDYAKLFFNPAQWSTARQKIDVFKTFEGIINVTQEGLGKKMIEGEAYIKINRWGMDLAMDVGAVKHHTCLGRDSAALALSAARIAEANGGRFKSIAMDWPSMGGSDIVNGETCGYTIEESARETANFIRAVKQARPDIEVGDIIGYPLFKVEQIIVWLSLLYNQENVSIDFLHLDLHHTNPWLQDPKNRKNLAPDLLYLKSILDANGIPFGMILWGTDGSSPEAYYNNVMRWVNEVDQIFENNHPRDYIIQSWGGADPTTGLPINLPETAPYTHTKIINDAYAVLMTSPPREPSDPERRIP